MLRRGVRLFGVPRTLQGPHSEGLRPSFPPSVPAVWEQANTECCRESLCACLQAEERVNGPRDPAALLGPADPGCAGLGQAAIQGKQRLLGRGQPHPAADQSRLKGPESEGSLGWKGVKSGSPGGAARHWGRFISLPQAWRAEEAMKSPPATGQPFL